MRCCLSAPLAALAALPTPYDVLRSGTLLVPALLRAAYVGSRRHPDTLAAVHLELVTLTEDRAVLTWYTGIPGTADAFGHMLPARTEGEVVYGTHPAHLNRTAAEERPTAHHHVELTDLEPGQTYYYRARSRGVPATPTPLHHVRGNAVGTSRHGFGGHRTGVYSFTTPQPPPGSHVMTIALCNDLHLGETTAGLMAGFPLLRGVSQTAGRTAYPEIMGRALVEEARGRGADVLLAAGDLSAGGAPRDVTTARRILDGFGTLGRDYLVVRGNHDRPPAPWADPFAETFGTDAAPAYFAHDLGGLRIIGLDTYDKTGNGGDAGALGPDQLSWFRDQLRSDPDRPTLVFGHHPLTVRDSVFPVTRGQRMDARQARAIIEAYASAPGVFLHHAGHTHRNKRTALPRAPHVTQQEVTAAKDYPGGFCLVRIHTGGYALNHYKTTAPESREWAERSRRAAGGLWPHHALGRTATDRNSVHRHDLSGITAPRIATP